MNDDALNVKNEALYARFSDVFNSDAELIAARPSALLGEKYNVKGMKYSLPAVLYVADRTLSNDDSPKALAESYDYYVQNIKMQSAPIVFKQHIVEEFCHDTIQELRTIRKNAEINANICPDDNESKDHPNFDL